MTLEEYQKLSKEEQKKVSFNEMPKGVRYAVIILLGIIVLVAFFLLKGCFAPPPPLTAHEQIEKNKSELIKRAQAHTYELREMIKKNFNHPRTVNFPIGNSSYTVTNLDSGYVTLIGTGTAKNSFGVEDGFKYYILLKAEGNDMRVINQIVTPE